MEYFLKYPNFNVLKNNIMKDSLCDWFEINNDKYMKDENNFYKNHIVKEAQNYKIKILKKILELSELNIPLKTSFNQTKELLYNDSQLILQGVLLDKNNIFVDCDLIITYKLFKKIFPKINNLPFHLYCKNENDYLLIDICYSSLHFKIDLKYVQNEGIIFYKKCKLLAFQEIFQDFFNLKCQSLILGKEYFYKNTLLPKKNFIAKLENNEKIKLALQDSIKWIKYLKNNHDKLKIDPKPNHVNLYPNMNYNNSQWENEKMKLANKIKEITLVWNISYEERCKLFENGIKSWDDPKILNKLKESKKKDIQERMIHMNQQEDILIYPRKNVSKTFRETIKSSNTDIYFDIESFLSFDEKQSLFTNEIKIKEPIIGIIGFIYDNNFYNVTINEYIKKDEERMIKQFSSYLYKISKNEIINIYHWGHAENNYLKYIHETYPNISFPEYKLINVLDYFRTEPIIVQGIFKFGIKSVGKALYKHGLIKTTWDKNDSGLESMIQFKESCKQKNKKIPLKRYIEISEIIEYNRIDCQVLYEIVELLRKKY